MNKPLLTYTATVILGKGIGKKLGFPTANLSLPEDFNLSHGVYIGRVNIDGNDYLSLSNVGKHPTFPEGKPSIETFILDFNGDLYGKELKVNFYKKIRDEITFKDKESLITQIEKDVRATRMYFLQG